MDQHTSLMQRRTLGKADALEGWGFTLYGPNSIISGNVELVCMVKIKHTKLKQQYQKKGSKDDKCFPFWCAVLYLKSKETRLIISKQSQLLMTLTG